MNKLIKPQKQSYTGEDAQVVAYADPCEMAWVTGLAISGMGAAGLYMAALTIAIPPLFAAVAVSLVIHYAIFSLAC